MNAKKKAYQDFCKECDKSGIEYHPSREVCFESGWKLVKADIALKELIKIMEQIAIELAYQKEGNKLVRKDINHLELFKRLKKELEVEDEKQD